MPHARLCASLPKDGDTAPNPSINLASKWQETMWKGLLQKKDNQLSMVLKREEMTAFKLRWGWGSALGRGTGVGGWVPGSDSARRDAYPVSPRPRRVTTRLDLSRTGAPTGGPRVQRSQQVSCPKDVGAAVSIRMESGYVEPALGSDRDSLDTGARAQPSKGPHSKNRSHQKAPSIRTSVVLIEGGQEPFTAHVTTLPQPLSPWVEFPLWWFWSQVSHSLHPETARPDIDCEVYP